jgi:hypothetical protein
MTSCDDYSLLDNWYFIGAMIALPILLLGVALWFKFGRNVFPRTQCPRCRAEAAALTDVNCCRWCGCIFDSWGNIRGKSDAAMNDLDLSPFKPRDAESEHVCRAEDGQVSNKAPP